MTEEIKTVFILNMSVHKKYLLFHIKEMYILNCSNVYVLKCPNFIKVSLKQIQLFLVFVDDSIIVLCNYD